MAAAVRPSYNPNGTDLRRKLTKLSKCHSGLAPLIGVAAALSDRWRIAKQVPWPAALGRGHITFVVQTAAF